MKVLSNDEAAEAMSVESLDLHLQERAERLQPAGVPRRIPKECGTQIALAKLLGYLLLRDSGVYVYLSRWSQHSASEHLDLLYAYRRSIGEQRTLSEASLHFFDHSCGEQLVSVLCLLFYFGWDAWIFDEKAKTIVRVTREKGLEVRTDGSTEIGIFAADPERFFAPLAA